MDEKTHHRRKQRYIVDLWEEDARPVWELLFPLAINMWAVPLDDEGSPVSTKSNYAPAPRPVIPAPAPHYTVNGRIPRNMNWCRRVWGWIKPVFVENNNADIRYDDGRFGEILTHYGRKPNSMSAIMTGLTREGYVYRTGQGMYRMTEKGAATSEDD